MFYRLRVQYSQFHSTSYTIVSTQGSTICRKPFTISIRFTVSISNIGYNRICREVYLLIHQLVTHHIHMTLYRQGRLILHTGSGWFPYQHITCFIDNSLQSSLLTKVLQKGNHLLLMF